MSVGHVIAVTMQVESQVDSWRVCPSIGSCFFVCEMGKVFALPRILEIK